MVLRLTVTQQGEISRFDLMESLGVSASFDGARLMKGLGFSGRSERGCVVTTVAMIRPGCGHREAYDGGVICWQACRSDEFLRYEFSVMAKG